MKTFNKLVKVALVFAALVVPGIAGPISAEATMCAFGCGVDPTSSMFQSYYGTGFVDPSIYGGNYTTGEMTSYDPQAIYQQMLMMQMTQYGMALNWNGAQPMGYSYSPPVGLSAISNSMNWRAMNTAITGN